MYKIVDLRPASVGQLLVETYLKMNSKKIMLCNFQNYEHIQTEIDFYTPCIYMHYQLVSVLSHVHGGILSNDYHMCMNCIGYSQ